MTSSPACWCGNTDLLPFVDQYLRCPVCETLVWSGTAEQPAVGADEQGYYGREYFLSHQAALGSPDIHRRAREDFTDRIPYWTREILKFKQPPGVTLEVGCSHGAFVSQLRQVGFDASGIDLSPWVVDFARKTFGIPAQHGLLRDQAIAPGSLDMLVLMDVVEHLPDPLEVLRQCAALIKPDGIVVIQTPCYPAGRSFAELARTQHPFIRMLIPQEHLFLYSQNSLKRLLAAAGILHVTFEPAYFKEYDMFCAAGKEEIRTASEEEAETFLLASPNGRHALALLDQAKITNRYQALYQQTNSALQHTNSTLLQTKTALEEMDRRVQQYRSLVNGLTASRVYKLLRRLGRFSWFDAEARQVNALADPKTKSSHFAAHPERELKRMIVDLTPILPGGENGGAKLLTLELIRLLSQEVAPQCEYILFTARVSHDELAWLDRENVRRICVNDGASSQAAIRQTVNLRSVLRKVGRLAPKKLQDRMSRWYRKTAEIPSVTRLVAELNADLVFCPFTAPFYYHPEVPIVIIVYDLQFMYYPEFFSHDELFYLDKYLRQSCQVANRLISISEYTRQNLLEKTSAQPEQVVTIHTNLVHPVLALDEAQVEDALKKYGLKPGEYLFFPANFWGHKNHAMLLTAFNRYLQEHPDSPLKLVFTGAPGERFNFIKQAVSKMGLNERVVMPGFLNTDAFSALARGCRALIFPSLFEGFGMPVVEAMSIRVPVLCSNRTSLPEIVGDAAITFDPGRPDDIVRAIQELETNPRNTQAMVERGAIRANIFNNTRSWAEAHWQVFLDAVHEGARK